MRSIRCIGEFCQWTKICHVAVQVGLLTFESARRQTGFENYFYYLASDRCHPQTTIHKMGRGRALSEAECAKINALGENVRDKQ